MTNWILLWGQFKVWKPHIWSSSRWQGTWWSKGLWIVGGVWYIFWYF